MLYPHLRHIQPFDQFFEQARYTSLDENEQRIYDRSLMDYWNLFAIEQTHYHEGLEKVKKLGLAEGKAQGALQMLISLVRDGMLSLEAAAHKASMSESAFKALMDK